MDVLFIIVGVEVVNLKVRHASTVSQPPLYYKPDAFLWANRDLEAMAVELRRKIEIAKSNNKFVRGWLIQSKKSRIETVVLYNSDYLTWLPTILIEIYSYTQ